jgi:3-phenylpropionate/cinnamic acid dioxygenase small subunit
MDGDPDVQALVDRARISDTLHRYASSIDGKDFVTLRNVFTDDATARYGARNWMTGADEIVAWIARYGVQQAWQHHLLSVYHVDIDGDTARTVTYHSCHQAPLDDPRSVTMMMGQYRDELRRVGETWRIARREMDVSWRETSRR